MSNCEKCGVEYPSTHLCYLNSFGGYLCDCCYSEERDEE
jgi:hypothetical protein